MRQLTLITIFLLILAGCSSKQYFEPTEVAGDVNFDGYLDSKLKSVSSYGAVLENQKVITKKGLLDITLPDGFKFLNQTDEYILVANSKNEFKIFQNSKEIKSLNFDSMVVSANKRDDFLALIFADNSILLQKISTDERVFFMKLDDIYAVNSKLAAPIFLNDLVLFPSLDGKVLIVDLINFTFIRDIVVSSDKFFSNIIFLNVVENRLICATSKKLLSINPNYTNSKEYDIRDISILDKNIYLFTVDGRVILLNLDLNELKEKKFNFAHFVGSINGKYIYIVEKNGYLIALDKDLIVSNVFQLETKIDDLIFTTEDRIYYQDRYFELNK